MTSILRRMVASSAPAPRPVTSTGVRAGDGGDDRGRRGGVADAHVAGDEAAGAGLDAPVGELDADVEGEEGVGAAHGRRRGRDRRCRAATVRWRRPGPVDGDRRGHADVDHRDRGTGLAGEHVDGGAAVAEVGHHLRGDLLRPGRDPAGDHPVIGGEHDDGGRLGDRRRGRAGDAGELHADRLEPAERAGRLGERVLQAAWRRPWPSASIGSTSARACSMRWPACRSNQAATVAPTLPEIRSTAVMSANCMPGGDGRLGVGGLVADVEDATRALEAQSLHGGHEGQGVGLGGADVGGGDDHLEQLVEPEGREQGAQVGFGHDRRVGDGTDAARGRPAARRSSSTPGRSVPVSSARRRARWSLLDEGSADVEQDGVEEGLHRADPTGERSPDARPTPLSRAARVVAHVERTARRRGGCRPGVGWPTVAEPGPILDPIAVAVGAAELEPEGGRRTRPRPPRRWATGARQRHGARRASTAAARRGRTRGHQPGRDPGRHPVGHVVEPGAGPAVALVAVGVMADHGVERVDGPVAQRARRARQRRPAARERRRRRPCSRPPTRPRPGRSRASSSRLGSRPTRAGSAARAASRSSVDQRLGRPRRRRRPALGRRRRGRSRPPCSCSTAPGSDPRAEADRGVDDARARRARRRAGLRRVCMARPNTAKGMRFDRWFAERPVDRQPVPARQRSSGAARRTARSSADGEHHEADGLADHAGGAQHVTGEATEADLARARARARRRPARRRLRAKPDPDPSRRWPARRRARPRPARRARSGAACVGDRNDEAKPACRGRRACRSTATAMSVRDAHQMPASARTCGVTDARAAKRTRSDGADHDRAERADGRVATWRPAGGRGQRAPAGRRAVSARPSKWSRPVMARSADHDQRGADQWGAAPRRPPHQMAPEHERR